MAHGTPVSIRIAPAPRMSSLTNRNPRMKPMLTKSSVTLLFSTFLLLFSGLINSINGSEFGIYEATIRDIQRAFTENHLTSRELVDFYLDRIQTLNPQLRGVLEVNPDAQNQAEEADRERESNHGGRLLGDLHGIPIMLKDSIATNDKLNTTAGSYALLGSAVPRDAWVVEKLRKAGAVILGKTSLNEWYGIRSFGFHWVGVVEVDRV